MKPVNPAIKISFQTMIANIFLSAFKLFAGLFAHSAAMVSDAVHSLSDVISTVIVIVGVRLSEKEADHDHPYGHERLECVAAIVLSVVLVGTGLLIGYEGILTLLRANEIQIQTPGVLALIAAVSSIVIKEVMFRYTKKVAQQVSSTALMADAWHHRSDALSSIGSLIGIVGARFGLAIFDPLASIVISLFIVKAAIDIFRDAIKQLTDHSCDVDTVKQIRCVVDDMVDVIEIDMVKTRQFGSKIYVDLEIKVDGNLSLNEAHKIAQEAHDLIEQHFIEVKHCMVHINPSTVRT